MGLRRDARKHDTTAVRKHEGAQTELWWEHQPDERVMTIDGPGRVVAVYDGPYPGSEEYEIKLEGGLGGGRYSPGQITAATEVTAVEHHTADKDYPELGTLLHDRPDPASLRYTAAIEEGIGLFPAAAPTTEGDDEGQVMRDASEYHSAPSGDFSLASRHTARQINGEEIDQHGSAPHWPRAGNPNTYDRISTEGEPDPRELDEAQRKQQAMAVQMTAAEKNFWNTRLPEIRQEHASTTPAKRELDRMEAVGDPHKESYAYQGDGGFWCPSCKKGRERLGEDTSDMEPISWHHLRHYGEPAGETCSDCMDELTPPRPHSLRSCSYGEDCPSADDAHDENLDRADQREWLKSPHHTLSPQQQHEMSDDLDPVRDRAVTPRKPDEAPLHITQDEEDNTDWGGHDDFHTVLMDKHEQHAGHERQKGAENQLKDLFSGPEFDQHREFMEKNPGKATHLSGKVAHAVDPIHPDDDNALANHLINEHGHDPEKVEEMRKTHRLLGGQHDLDHDEYQGLHEDDFLLPHHHAPVESTETRLEDFPQVPSAYAHPAWGGGYDRHDPYSSIINSVPAGVTDEDVPRHPSALSMLVTAAIDPSFRFHVTAAWRDVQAKAKRIRAQGGVQITHADEGSVHGNVRGDHNVYETGLQRHVGKRQSVAAYTCGCKWGAYHWGAPDDMSRFAGRMCSHALALQYEAASRGMFGRDVEIDDRKPSWVPSKVVIKYDIDNGQHIRATASVPEQSPLLVAIATMTDDDPAARVILASANDLFGDTTGYTEPSLMNPAGPTIPWDKNENPTSAGNLKAAEPDNWGNINGPTMLPRIATAITTEAFWQALIPVVRAVAPKLLKAVGPSLMGHEVKKHQPAAPKETTVPDGTEATLHDEPEPALPETDGERTASLGDVDIASATSVDQLPDDALSPESPSVQTHGSIQEIVAEFQRSASAQKLMEGGKPGDTSSSDIAQAAQAYLAKTAASSFTAAERDALINESPGIQASNTDRLDIAGTHYAELEDMDDGEDDSGWLM